MRRKVYCILPNTCKILLLFCISATVDAQFGSAPSEPEAKAVKSDLQYIRCDVCNILAKHAYRQIRAAEKELKPGKKLKEIEVLERIEKISDPLKDEGEWIAKIDLIENGDKLTAKEMEDIGKCGSECKTVQKAVEEILDYADTDIAEKLWQGKLSRSQFASWLCQEATPSCRQKPPPLPKGRPKGQGFEKMDPEEARMQKMMATMKEMGMGGQMFNRDQASAMASQGGAGYDDYGDDSNPGMAGSPDLFAGSASSYEDEGDHAESLVSKASESAQAAMDAATEAAKQGWQAAKSAGQSLFGKAQTLFGGNEAAAKADL